MKLQININRVIISFKTHKIRDITKDEAEAVALFFTLCDKFYEEYENRK